MDAAHLIKDVWYKLPIEYGLHKGVFNVALPGLVDPEFVRGNLSYRLKHMPQIHNEAALANIGFYNDTRRKFTKPPEFDEMTHKLGTGDVDSDGRVFWTVAELPKRDTPPYAL